MRPSKYFYDKPLPKYLDSRTVLIYRPHPVLVARSANDVSFRASPVIKRSSKDDFWQLRCRWSQGLILHQAFIDSARAAILLPMGKSSHISFSSPHPKKKNLGQKLRKKGLLHKLSISTCPLQISAKLIVRNLKEFSYLLFLTVIGYISM